MSRAWSEELLIKELKFPNERPPGGEQYVLTVHHGLEQLSAVTPLTPDLRIPLPQKSPGPPGWYEVRVALASNWKHAVGCFRVVFDRAADGVVHTCSMNMPKAMLVKYVCTGISEKSKMETLASWLKGSYGHLFASTNEVATTGAKFVFQPPIDAIERVLRVHTSAGVPSSSGNTLAPAEAGALVLTSLRLIFIPNFIDIPAVVEHCFQPIVEGGEQPANRSLAEVSRSLSSVGVSTDGFVFFMESRKQALGQVYSRLVSRQDLEAFLVATSLAAESTAPSNVIQLPLYHISALKVLAPDTAEVPSPAFPPGALSAKLAPSERASEREAGGSTTYTVYSIEVTGPAAASWVVERRFSEFAALQAELEGVSILNLPPLPPKSGLFGVDKDERWRGLSEYLAAVLLLGDACACGALGKFLEATPARLQAESYSPRAQLLSASLRSDGSAVSFLLPEVPHPEGHPAASKAMTARSWCEAVCCEVAWLNAEAEFPRAFSHSAELPTISEADPLLYPTSAALMRREYARFGLVEAPKSGEAGPEASGLWRLVDNSTYQICESYPSVFAVPASVSDADVLGSAAVRGNNRLPALTWLHPETGTPLCRSAQSLAGLLTLEEDHVEQDRALLAATQMATKSQNALKVVDARPKLLGAGDGLGSGGGTGGAEPFEEPVEFLNIENIHTMRHSLALLSAACRTEEDDFYALLAASKWLYHVKMILRGALAIASALERKTPVLVHCSDGWDRTSQLSALAQLLIDPFYRTIQGFARLIEKDFVSFGHMFEKRSDARSKEYSPVFLQFLDCVWQLTRQFPTRFEFNERFVVALADGFQSGWSTTFMGSSEQERDANAARFGGGPGLWQLIDLGSAAPGAEASDGNPSIRAAIRNPGYTKEVDKRASLLKAKVTMKDVQLWADIHLRHKPAKFTMQGGEPKRFLEQN